MLCKSLVAFELERCGGVNVWSDSHAANVVD